MKLGLKRLMAMAMAMLTIGTSSSIVLANNQLTNDMLVDEVFTNDLFDNNEAVEGMFDEKSDAEIIAEKRLSLIGRAGVSKAKIMREQKAFEEATGYKEVFAIDPQDEEFPAKFGEYIKNYNEYCNEIGESDKVVPELSDNPTMDEIEALHLNMGSGGDSAYTGDGNSFKVTAMLSGEFVLPDQYGVCLQGLINHAAMYDSSRYYSNSSRCFLSANDDDNRNGKGYSYTGVGYESPNYYRNCFDQVYCGYVPGEDASEALSSAQSAASVGESYSLNTTKSNTSKWYCSKVLWYGYEHGLDIDIDYDGGPFVFPVDIYNDEDVSIWISYE